MPGGVQQLLFEDPDPDDFEAEALLYVAWLQRMGTIEDTMKSQPGCSISLHDCTVHCSIGGWIICGDVYRRTKRGHFVIQIGDDFREYKLSEWWETVERINESHIGDG